MVPADEQRWADLFSQRTAEPERKLPAQPDAMGRMTTGAKLGISYLTPYVSVTSRRAASPIANLPKRASLVAFSELLFSFLSFSISFAF
jgi:hypothetical protein